MSDELCGNFIWKCQLCQTKQNLKKCSVCRSVWYCSREHQVEDWRRHKLNECKTLLCKREKRKELKLNGLNKSDFGFLFCKIGLSPNGFLKIGI